MDFDKLGMMYKPKILTFSTLFPHAYHPTHGIFVEERLRHLQASGEILSRVVAPVPWFPITHPTLNKYAWHARNVAPVERRHGLTIFHPRYLLLPKTGMSLAPLLLAAGSIGFLRKLKQREFDFDLIDAHYFFPDGVAAIMLGAVLAKPVVITARGSDLNQIPDFFFPRQQIKWAAKRAAGLITVCAALKEILVRDMGIPDHRIEVLRNGVDLHRFQRLDREQSRQRLGFTRPTILSVGFLIDRKGHDIVIRAMKNLPHMDLVIVGDGPQRENLQQIPEAEGVAHQVRFVGEIKQDRLPEYYSAADALVLASSREGWANVLLEAMACGLPVVATKVWGTPEAVCVPEAGVLMTTRSPQGVVDGIKALMANYPEPLATRKHAEKFTWDATTAGQLRLFRDII